MSANKRGFAALFILLSAVGLSGCLWSAGNERPMSMTVRDGGYVFHWCGEPTGSFQYLEINYATFTPGREDFVALRAKGDFKFQPADEFSLSNPPAGLEVEYDSAIPVENAKMLIFVDTGDSEDELNGISAIFRTEGAAKLDGRWLYPSGTVHDTPCEMRGAQ
ncbi:MULTISPECIES: hypothetical protein [unclassified Microbacterium]|uniref:hypothetical protein n=1 Tax=Microbacterium TaxID=33882 RepID=UPI000DE4D615|nr:MULTISPECIES: hypothetical protein [unclassified Microbacterium]NYF30183.1 hypothetical protein [Microbacterium sp. JAI119]RBO71241.1 hypothetical protein DSP71_17635 [Microbacterium sp. H6]